MARERVEFSIDTKDALILCIFDDEGDLTVQVASRTSTNVGSVDPVVVHSLVSYELAYTTIQLREPDIQREERTMTE